MARGRKTLPMRRRIRLARERRAARVVFGGVWVSKARMIWLGLEVKGKAYDWHNDADALLDLPVIVDVEWDSANEGVCCDYESEGADG